VNVAVGAAHGADRSATGEAGYAEPLAPGIAFLGVADGFGTLPPIRALELASVELRRRARAGAFQLRAAGVKAIREYVLAALASANAHLYARSGSNDDYIAGGISTAIGLLVGGLAVVAHVGDVRVFLARDGRLTRLTYDDEVTIESEGVPSASASPLGALPPVRSLLWRTLGSQARLEAGVLHLELEPEDRLLLITGGVSRGMGIDELTEELLSAESAQAAIEAIFVRLRRAEGSGAAVVALEPMLSLPMVEAKTPPFFQRPSFYVPLVIACALAALVFLGLHHDGRLAP